MQMSLDGFVAGANGEMDWLTWNWDDELKKYINELTENIDLILLGRKLAEGFIPTWRSRAENPETADDFSRKMVDTPKIVFSDTLEKSGWENAQIAEGDSQSVIKRLKEETGQDIIVYGGGSFVSSLIKDNLIDEYNLFINPVALGSGMPIFNSLKNNLNLSLNESRSFECGIVALRYDSK